MATSFSKNLFASTYKDDYVDSDNYHRILFNAGRALQARELTQMQTITQTEMSRLLRHLFKDGNPVNSGNMTSNNEYEFIKLDTSINPYPTGAALTTLNSGSQRLTSTEGVIVEVIESTAYVSAAEPATLFVRYVSTQAETAGSEPIRVTPGTTLSGGDFTFTVQTTNTPSNPAVGQGTRFSIDAGDFYVKERLVFTGSQSIIVSKYSSTPNATIGLKVTESIVTTADDPNLFDNQGATLNRSAPGADRYRIRLTLAVIEDLTATDNYIYLAQIRNGVKIDENVTGDDYNIPEKLLATRTFEESGNYIAKNFILKFDTNEDDNTKVDLDISNGVAYVDGYRAFINLPTKFTIDKPRTTELTTDEAISASYGYYYIGVASSNAGLPNPFEQVTLKSGSNFTGTTLGTAYVSAVEENNDGNFRIHLFGVERESGANLGGLASLGTSTTNYINILAENDTAVLKEAAASSYLFDLPITRPQSVTGADITVHRYFGSISATSNQVQLTGLTDADWTNTTDFVFSRDSDVSFTATLASGGTAGDTFANFNIDTVTIDDGTLLEVHGFVLLTNAQPKQKSLTTTTSTITPAGNGTVNLGKADVYDVLAIRSGSVSGADISSRYEFDNGQRDTHYDLGQLRLKPGQTAPAGDVYVQFRYFEHLAGGHYFAVNSYSGQIDYEDIPDYTKDDGSTVNLRDVLDFRSVKSPSDDFTSAGSIQFRLPRNAQAVQADVKYYLGKTLRIGIDQNSAVSVLEGEPSLVPQLPAKPTGTLDLFHVHMNPYMLNDGDLFTNQIRAQRYTMQDIDLLEQRLSKLEEVTSLSLLETQTDNLLVFDSAGNSRLKSGFFVDNFYDHARALTTSADYHASIDPQQGILRPSFVEQERRLKFDSDNSTNVVLKGDNVYLSYTHSTYQDQQFASEYININPYAVVRKEGFMELSPTTDNWVERDYVADNVIDGGVTISNNASFGWNNWLWNWAGQLQGQATFGASVQNESIERRISHRMRGWRTVVGTFQTARITSDRVIRNTVGDRLLDTAFIPFMRSRKVYFRAWGLKPNHRMFPFFDNVDVSSWVKVESYSRHSQNDEDYGNRYNAATQHPDTPTSEIITGADGTLAGSFFIPSTAARRFRTGTREFKLMDINVAQDDNALCIARANFTSTGVLETRQRDIVATRRIVIGGGTTTRAWLVDPLAQTFFVPETEGVYVTKVGIHFATVDSTIPVICQIRPTVNGVPSSTEILAMTQQVPTAVPADLTTASMTDVQGLETVFEFDEPVYLTGGNEYSIVLIADTTTYNVYVSKAGDFQLNTTAARVAKQPSLGSLFKSQNARTWTPDQERDLMFTLYKANFSTSQGVARLVNVTTPLELIQTNELLTDSGDSGVYIPLTGHGFVVGDTVNIAGAEAVGGISAGSINGVRTIESVDGYGFKIIADSAANATALGGGTAVLTERQVMMDVAVPLVETLVPPNTTIRFTGKFLSGVSLTSNDGLSGYNQDTSFTPIVINDNNIFNTPKVIASERVEAAQGFDANNGNKSVQINAILNSSNSNVSPMLDMQRCSILAVNNLIDRQAAAATSGFNVPNTYIAETSPSGGTHLAKHITLPVALENPATGIKVLLAANRPNGSYVDLYYRTNTSQDSAEGILFNTEWILQDTISPVATDDNITVFREYEYLIGGDNGDLTPFDQMQFKIVMKSTNSSKVPQIRDFRAIALST
jgi:hypothetical protein